MNFNAAVAQSVEEPVVVLLSTDECKPCKTLKPMLRNAAELHGFPLVELNAHDNRALMMELGIRSVPLMLILKNQQIMGKFVGAQTSDQLHGNIINAGISKI